MIYCLCCGKAHLGCYRLAHSEKQMYSVMLLNSQDKQYFCNPLCYLDYQQGSVKMPWKSVENWFLAHETPEDVLYRHFSSFRDIMRLDKKLTIAEARQGFSVHADSDVDSDFDNEEVSV